MRALIQNIPIQPSTTSISQNDNLTFNIQTLQYNEDHTLQTTIPLDDIILINTTRQEYLTLQNIDTHNETTGMTQKLINSAQLSIFIYLNTNKLTVNVLATTLEQHNWARTDEFLLIILQEDEKIEIPFKVK